MRSIFSKNTKKKKKKKRCKPHLYIKLIKMSNKADKYRKSE